MTLTIPDLRQYERWLRESAAEASGLLPALLALSGPELLRELHQRPELRTVGVVRAILAAAEGKLVHDPARAYALTAAIVQCVHAMEIPEEFAFARLLTEAEAWKQHARATRETGRTGPALWFIRHARRLYEQTPASGWHLAEVDLIEAPLIHDRAAPGGPADGAPRRQ